MSKKEKEIELSEKYYNVVLDEISRISDTSSLDLDDIYEVLADWLNGVLIETSYKIK